MMRLEVEEGISKCFLIRSIPASSENEHIKRDYSPQAQNVIDRVAQALPLVCTDTVPVETEKSKVTWSITFWGGGR